MQHRVRSILEAPASFPTLDRAFALFVLAAWRKEHTFALALMIPLAVKMLHIVCQRRADDASPKSIRAPGTLLDGAHPPLRIGMQIGDRAAGAPVFTPAASISC